jgi:hypothetical protein
MATATKAAKDTPEPEQVEVEEDEGFEPVLDFDTAVRKRPTIRLRTASDRDGQLVEVRRPEEFGIEEDQRFRAELREYGALMAKDKLTSAERKALKSRLDELARKILDTTPEILNTLRDRDRQKIVTYFTSALLVDDATALPDMTARIGSITES